MSTACGLKVNEFTYSYSCRNNGKVRSLVRNLRATNLFNISTSEKLKPIGGATRCVLNGVEFLLEHADLPASTMWSMDRGHYKGISLIICLQASRHWIPEMQTIYQKHGIVVTPFPYPSMPEFPLGEFQWENKPHTHLCNFAFAKRGNRMEWLTYHQNTPWVYHKQLRSTRQYMEVLRDTHWGLSLQGIVTKPRMDGKCYRESEYMSLGFPLALNYQPFYPFSFQPNVDYVFLEKPEDLVKLKDIDPLPFAHRSTHNYQQWFSPLGMSQLLLDILSGKHLSHLIQG